MIPRYFTTIPYHLNFLILPNNKNRVECLHRNDGPVAENVSEKAGLISSYIQKKALHGDIALMQTFNLDVPLKDIVLFNENHVLNTEIIDLN